MRRQHIPVEREGGFRPPVKNKMSPSHRGMDPFVMESCVHAYADRRVREKAGGCEEHRGDAVMLITC